MSSAFRLLGKPLRLKGQRSQCGIGANMVSRLGGNQVCLLLPMRLGVRILSHMALYGLQMDITSSCMIVGTLRSYLSFGAANIMNPNSLAVGVPALGHCGRRHFLTELLRGPRHRWTTSSSSSVPSASARCLPSLWAARTSWLYISYHAKFAVSTVRVSTCWSAECCHDCQHRRTRFCCCCWDRRCGRYDCDRFCLL
ncbi:hypothetical protein VTK73DRAFT_6643 [Phialemonium thermophilum]|uniref:Uncharacterized protein n=1 Tax=Phialemonium thermophilum TaxID=223376 RepID=A0ABR3WIT0_9PEZI